jgi:nucleotide-binding universal stress UspA family protein
MDTPPAGRLHIVVGYDGSPPASRALDGAVRLLRGRDGRIIVAYIGHVPSLDMLSADAIAEIEADFDEIGKELRASAAEQLGADGVAWEFQQRQGLIAEQLIEAASAIGHDNPGDTTVIAVGSSSKASHRIVGSVAVSLARHCPVPLLIVP